MIEQNQILQFFSVNKQNIIQKYQLKKIGIFGSYARGEQKPDSDLDLLVEFEDNTLNLTEKKELLQKEIQAIFNVNVDICREKYIKPVFRQHILRMGLQQKDSGFSSTLFRKDKRPCKQSLMAEMYTIKIAKG